MSLVINYQKGGDEMEKKTLVTGLRQFDFNSNLVILLFKFESISKKKNLEGNLNGFYLRATW